MSQMLKCPNPSCPYIFDPSQVPVGVVLSCPRCGMQFTLGPPPPAAPAPPSYPTAPSPPTGYPPSQATGAPAPPAGAPAAPRRKGSAPPPGPEFEAAGKTAVKERGERDGEDRPRSGGGNGTQMLILAGVAAVLMLGTLAVGLFLIFGRGGGSSSANATRLEDLNVAIDGFPTTWTRDDNARVKVGSPYVMVYRRENPEAYIAFGATEPEKGRMPRPTEMRRDMMAPFPKLFDISTLRQEPPAASEWLGASITPAEPFPAGFTFRAQSADGLTWKGETYTVANKGIAYYWLSWCGENDYEALKGEFADMRAKFKLLDLRKNWKETHSNVNDFKGDTVPYTVSDAEGLWKEVPAAELEELKKVEPDLDKRLRIRLTPRRDRKARPEEAELSVYLLTGAAGDPTETARQYAKDLEINRIKQANSDFAPPTFTELTDPPHGDPTPTSVPATAPVARMLSSVKESKSANRLIVASGIKSGDKTVVVICWCEANKRDIFETKFVQIASSLR